MSCGEGDDDDKEEEKEEEEGKYIVNVSAAVK